VIARGNSGVWRTKDGRDIPFSELKDDHLFFVIKMLEEKGAAAAWASRNHDEVEMTDEQILEAVEAKLARLSSLTVARYGGLIEERERRIMAGNWNPGTITVPKPKGLPPRIRT
jgi:hypothetical protein